MVIGAGAVYLFTVLDSFKMWSSSFGIPYSIPFASINRDVSVVWDHIGLKLKHKMDNFWHSRRQSHLWIKENVVGIIEYVEVDETIALWTSEIYTHSCLFVSIVSAPRSLHVFVPWSTGALKGGLETPFFPNNDAQVSIQYQYGAMG